MPFWDRMVSAMRAAGVEGVCSCGTSPDDWERLAVLCRSSLPFKILPGFGVHPWAAGELPSGWEESLKSYLEAFPQAVVGEIGLDGLKETGDDGGRQLDVFLAQLEIACAYDRPVVLHGARRWGPVCDVIGGWLGRLKGVLLHGVSLSEEMLHHPALRHPKVYFSIGGSITLTNADRLRQMVRAIPLDRLLVETDTPDIFPVGGEPLALGFPGKPLNQPANLVCVLETLAAVRKIDYKTLSDRTTRNAGVFFGF